MNRPTVGPRGALFLMGEIPLSQQTPIPGTGGGQGAGRGVGARKPADGCASFSSSCPVNCHLLAAVMFRRVIMTSLLLKFRPSLPDREDVGHEACLSSETLSSRGDRASLVTGHLCGTGGGQGAGYSIAERETSLTRNTPLLGPYRRTIPRVPWWS